jgi:RNA polymerase sigma factor (sigma-70 family)
MTDQDWKQLEEMLGKARAGEEYAFTEACRIIDQKLKRQVKAIVRQTGVRPEESVHDAWQEAMLAFVKHYQQVETIRHLPYWLAITALRAGWKDRWPRYSKKKKPEQMVEQTQQPPEPIGTKPLTIAGREYQVKIYASDPPAAPSERMPRLEPLTDSIIERYGKTTFPDYVRQIHNKRTLTEVLKALAHLRPRWRRAIKLVCLDERYPTEAAQILGCKKKRLEKLLKKSRKRLRLLCPGATIVPKRKTKSRSAEGNARQAGTDTFVDDAWWPLVLESLRRHTEAMGFDAAEFVGQGGEGPCKSVSRFAL